MTTWDISHQARDENGKFICGETPRLCSIDGCERNHIAKGLCDIHYRYEHYDSSYRVNLYTRMREDVLSAYGHACECCGLTESVFLSIDHINGNGASHRKEYHGSIYQWLRQHDYPRDNFRILCHNCNFAVRFGDCPHGQDS